MQIQNWNISSQSYDPKNRFSRDALFTTGNGCFGIRGFFEEDNHGIGALGGIYMAGVFGKGYQEVCSGNSRELCNLPNVLRLIITANGKQVLPSPEQSFCQELDMLKGEYIRRYTWSEGGSTLKLEFRRFACLDRVNEICQQVSIEAEGKPAELALQAMLDSDVTNLNLVSSEPLPVQPGRSHIAHLNIGCNRMEVTLDDEDSTRLDIAQAVICLLDGEKIESTNIESGTACGQEFKLVLQPGKRVVLEKSVIILDSKEPQDQNAQQVFLQKTPCYADAMASHCEAWAKRWSGADICIKGSERDQGAIRYNLFQLMAACPLHTDKVSIGARGLSGEMYEGCVFWDNEIFQLPFFCWTEPDSARRLLGFRRNTLAAAKERAAELWFKGAMYPWQVSEKGREQTVKEVGAFYAIHITADIAYAIMQYICITGDTAILRDGGTEILVETARFWVSRCDFDPEDGKYHLRVVRGPNEYDVYVDDNAYTNYLAVCNLRYAQDALKELEKLWPEEYASLVEKLGITKQELEEMQNLAQNIVIPQNSEKNLVLEDIRYEKRREMDLKRAKPTGRRIIDSTLPYEALPLYQITKQADVVLLMNLFPGEFTLQEQANAYDYYEPRTAHDSSLSYAPHGLLAARLGRTQQAYDYFQKSAFLDVDDRQLNTISGLHYANFGGTWQMIFGGFAGISQKNNELYIQPNLPQQWNQLEVSCSFKGTTLHITVEKNSVNCTIVSPKPQDKVIVHINGEAFTIDAQNPSARA